LYHKQVPEIVRGCRSGLADFLREFEQGNYDQQIIDASTAVCQVFEDSGKLFLTILILILPLGAG